MSTPVSTSSLNTTNVRVTYEGYRDSGVARSTKHDYVHARLTGLAVPNLGSLQLRAHDSSHHGSGHGTAEHVLLTSGIVFFLLIGAAELLNVLLEAVGYLNGWVAAVNLPWLPVR